ncbi:hypothetical protein IEQ34_022481 [Dendrobium chrysotoxum]|uniref:Protein LOW PSII ACCUMULATION 2, chloroplastic n=1 Tax=Dendrobium chrysotoxum TaxID=161865 RepID=A0AAV7FX81_DENCH|nr:hypothetical protein IEQ34_022481 [Dendrobium chrysotoxum]
MESAATLLSTQPQRLFSSLPRSLKRHLAISTSYPSIHFLSLLTSSFPGRGTSFLSKAEPSEGLDSPNSTDLYSASAPPSPPPSKKTDSSGAGFGAAVDEKKKRKRKGRSAVIRRIPIEKSSIFSPTSDDIRSSQEQQGANEGAFLLAWLGLGGLILIEGIALAASGFLPEQWDNFFTKYLYPSFTPTVAVFVGGTVVYGVYKYLQAEKMKG